MQVEISSLFLVAYHLVFALWSGKSCSHLNFVDELRLQKVLFTIPIPIPCLLASIQKDMAANAIHWVVGSTT